VRHPYLREFFAKPADKGARTQAEDFIGRIVMKYPDIDEIILGRGQKTLVRSTHRTTIAYAGEALASYLERFTDRARGAALVRLPDKKFLLLASLQSGPVSDGVFAAIILNSHELQRIINSWPNQDTQGAYLAFGDDKRYWLFAGGEDGSITARVRTGETTLAQYETERFIEFGYDRFRNLSAPVRLAQEELLLGVLEGEASGGWYIPFILDSAVFLFAVFACILLFVWLLYCIYRAHSDRRENTIRGIVLLTKALAQSQENCRQLMESSKRLVRQTSLVQSRVRRVSLPTVDMRLQSNLLMSAEPDLARLRRLISAPSRINARLEGGEGNGLREEFAEMEAKRVAGGDI
jgi:hypothetical protein